MVYRAASHKKSYRNQESFCWQKIEQMHKKDHKTFNDYEIKRNQFMQYFIYTPERMQQKRGIRVKLFLIAPDVPEDVYLIKHSSNQNERCHN